MSSNPLLIPLLCTYCDFETLNPLQFSLHRCSFAARATTGGAQHGYAPARPVLPAARVVSADDPTDVDPTGLRLYQLEGARWLRSRARGLLADAPGVGKTAQVLRALPARARAVVVCPAHLRLVWKTEAAKWRPDLKASPGELREPAAGEVVIVSYDALPAAVAGSRWALDPSMRLRDATLVLDESHYAKNRRAQRTRRVRLLARQCRRVWSLTGTPLLGKPEDLWGVLQSGLLDRDSYGSWETFCEAFGATKKRVKRDLAVTVFGEATELARELLARVTLRRTIDQVLPELPKVVRSTIEVEAPEDLRPMLDDALARWTDPTELPPFELLSAALAALARSRIPQALAHVKDVLETGEPFVVFSAHREPILALRGLPGVLCATGDESPDERARMALMLQSGAAQCVAGTIQAIGTGLTMTRAARCLFVDEDYTPGQNEQAEGRLRRFGQERCVVSEVMVSSHPLDLRRREILERKRALIEKAVGA